MTHDTWNLVKYKRPFRTEREKGGFVPLQIIV
jgi:hypothetical protein